MPELPEVEILVRHLRPLVVGKRVLAVTVVRPKAVRPLTGERFRELLEGAHITGVGRRAKYLCFDLAGGRGSRPRRLLGHLGMTGRMYVQAGGAPRARHVSVVIGMGNEDWVFEDVRQFGGLTFEEQQLDGLGPEPLEDGFTEAVLRERLGSSNQAVKVRLMDQQVLAGLGNIYASEALHWAGIAPHRPACSLKPAELVRLRDGIRAVLEIAIRTGESLALDFAGGGGGDGLFYYGRAAEAPATAEERFRVYDRAGQPCGTCQERIERSVLAGRSTYFCRRCQR
jgi:formamidopyrimidine-DNA glycosylase